MKNLILANIAILLFIALEPISFFYVVIVKGNSVKGYWRSFAVDVDRFGNHQFRSLFNKILIQENGYQFGNFDETISSVIGKNKIANTLSKTGIILDKILDFFDKNHSIKSIPKEEI